jgi:hypothetical protein
MIWVHLCQPIELAEISLDHPQARHSIDREKALQCAVKLSNADPELLANRPH